MMRFRSTALQVSLGALLLSSPSYIWPPSGIASDISAQDKEDIDNTIIRYKAAVGMNPKNPKNFIQLGIAYLTAGKLDLAAQAFRDAQKLAPDSADPYVGLARALVRQGDKHGALKALE